MWGFAADQLDGAALFPKIATYSEQEKVRDAPVWLIIMTSRMGAASELVDLAGFELARHPLPRLKC